LGTGPLFASAQSDDQEIGGVATAVASGELAMPRTTKVCTALVTLVTLSHAPKSFAVEALPQDFASSPAAVLCRMDSTQIIDFGAYDPTAETDLETAAEIRLKCSQSVIASLLFRSSDEPEPATAQRQMRNGDQTLAYELYCDRNCTTAPAPQSTATAQIDAEGSVALTVYGRIPRNQFDVAPGTYTDSVTITIVY
jgi:spore coat protein U-like protein